VQCTRCKSIVADSAAMCPTCGNALGGVDSYGVTSFAPVLPAPQPAAHVSVRNPNAAQQDAGVAATMMSSSVAVPPTMASNAQSAPPQPGGARYVVTPARGEPIPLLEPLVQQQAPPPTMQSAPMSPQVQPMPNYGMVPMPSAPMTPGAYGPPQQPNAIYSHPYAMAQPNQPAPGLAIASFVCGLLGLVPFWIGFILCLLAVIFGSIVLFNTRSGQPGRGYATAGLVCGLLFFIPAACGL